MDENGNQLASITGTAGNTTASFPGTAVPAGGLDFFTLGETGAQAGVVNARLRRQIGNHVTVVLVNGTPV